MTKTLDLKTSFQLSVYHFFVGSGQAISDRQTDGQTDEHTDHYKAFAETIEKLTWAEDSVDFGSGELKGKTEDIN